MKVTGKSYQGLSTLTLSLPDKSRNIAKRIFDFLRKGRLDWDPWILKDGDFYRLFYLMGSSKVDPWWKKGAIGGAISTDMKRWTDLGIILESGVTNSWDSGRICAGSVYKDNDTYYLFYSASKGEPEILQEGIGLAISNDGLHWQRYSHNTLLEPDECWYSKQVKHPYYQDIHSQWRDPYIIKDEKSGKYYMFITACSKQREPSSYAGCVGLAVADNIVGPYKVLPPAAAPVVDGINESPYYEVERPQVIYRNDKYHLFFSCWTVSLNPKWVQKMGQDQYTDSSVYWYISDDITGPYKPAKDRPIVKGSEKTGLYGTNFIPAPDNPKELVAYGWYPGMYTIGVSPLLRFHWNNDSLELK